MSTLAGSVLRGQSALPALLDQVRVTFGMTSATLARTGSDRLAQNASRRRRRSPTAWRTVKAGTSSPAPAPIPVCDQKRVTPTFPWATTSPSCCADDRCRRPTGGSSEPSPPKPLSRSNSDGSSRSRHCGATGRRRPHPHRLLAAVSHDLRTPLSAAKAAITSLRSTDIDWAEEERRELLATADESLDRLIRLVENLLGMSRLRPAP